MVGNLGIWVFVRSFEHELKENLASKPLSVLVLFSPLVKINRNDNEVLSCRNWLEFRSAFQLALDPISISHGVQFNENHAFLYLRGFSLKGPNHAKRIDIRLHHHISIYQ